MEDLIFKVKKRVSKKVGANFLVRHSSIVDFIIITTKEVFREQN